ncbi:MAG: hypothetical protein EA398_11455 [Deltaproteobacteria bacterium]|nr:MAG: hypothetical protein EA398_11455 [Deltaproteobacteria bacterium]
MGVALLLFGCSAGTQVVDPEALAALRVEQEPPGTLRFSSAGVAPGSPAAFVLEPAEWPEGTGLQRPVIGIGEVSAHREGRPLIHAIRQHTGTEHLRIRFTDALRPLAGSKAAVEIIAVDGDIVQLRGGERVGMEEGDLYLIANRGVPPHRRADRYGAIVQLTDVIDREATGIILHATDPVEEGQVAVFGQLRPEESPLPVTVLVGPFGPDGERLPVDEALFDLVEAHQLSNVTVELVDTWIDPALPDADGAMRAALDREEHAIVVWGAILPGGEVRMHTTTTGESPRDAALVGIMTGGLPAGNEPGGAAGDVALSALAAGLAARGDHLLAAWLLEVSLRDRAERRWMEYHLREHLALRWANLEQHAEAFILMNEDIAEGERDNDDWVVVNARSIRASLHLDLGERRLWAEDLLAYAEGALAMEPGERAALNAVLAAQALARLERLDEAEARLREAEALADGEDAEQQYRIGIERALLLEAQDDPAGSLLLLDALEAAAERIGAGAAARHHLLVSEFYLIVEDTQRSMVHMERALRAAEESGNAPTRARILERSGHLLRVTGSLRDAGTAYERAAVAHMEAGTFHGAVEMLSAAGQVQLERLPRVGQGPEGAGVLSSAIRNLSLSGQLALRLGRNLDAAQALLLTGLFDMRMGQVERGFERMQEAWLLGVASADFETMTESARLIGEALYEAGRREEARTWQDRATLWRDFSRGASPEVEAAEGE